MKWMDQLKRKKKPESTLTQVKKTSSQLKAVKLQNPIKSVGSKLFIIIFASILLCVVIIGSLSYSKSKSIIKSTVADGSQETIVQASEKLQLLLQGYTDLSMQIMLDPVITNYLSTITFDDSYTQYVEEGKVNDKLNSIAYSNDAIKSIHIIKLEDGTGFSTETFTEDPKLLKQDWVKKVIAADGVPVWLDTKPGGYFKGASSGNEPIFAMGRIMISLTSATKQYMLLIELKMNEFSKSYESIQIGDSKSLFLVNSSNMIMQAQNSKQVLKKSSIGLPKNKSGKVYEDINGKQNLVVYNTIDGPNWKLIGSAPVEQLVKDAKGIFNLTIIMSVISALLAIAIGIFVIILIARPLMHIRNLMKEGEKGNLLVRTKIKGNDEIGQLGTSFNAMMEQITHLVKQTRSSAEEVLNTAGELSDVSRKTALAAGEISAATEEIATGASTLAVEAERGNELTHHIGTQMQNVIESNLQMGTSASEVRQVSEQGSEYMAVLMSKTSSTEEMTRSMVEKVNRLKDSTSSIRKILDVLNNMTKQTNILSLNATIEAARAGAAGKGFMVVADEIRKLADQSRQSIDVVGQITEKIQGEIDETVAVLTEAYPLFKEQIESVKEAETIFLQVKGQMHEFIEKLDGATQSIQELDKSQNILTEAMSSVSAVSQQSSATSEEVASLSSEQTNVSQGLVNLSEKLQSLSNALNDSLTRFQV